MRKEDDPTAVFWLLLPDNPLHSLVNAFFCIAIFFYHHFYAIHHLHFILPHTAYQFIIYDCGVMQTPTSIFRDADHRLLCGSVLPYEIPVFHKALSECGSLEVRPVAICVPQEIQEYCMELFGENVQIAAASHDLFAKRVNGQIYRPLVEKYIAGEKRL